MVELLKDPRTGPKTVYLSGTQMILIIRQAWELWRQKNESLKESQSPGSLSPGYLPGLGVLPLAGWVVLLAPSPSVLPIQAACSASSFRAVHNWLAQNPESSRV